jgi:putative spermidine/putrescine transport system substrate-binding protein/spermidine/putrescine transport system substrate-binding protein
MTAEQRQGLHLGDVDAYQKRIYFWQDVPRRAKYNEIWNEVKASQGQSSAPVTTSSRN